MSWFQVQTRKVHAILGTDVRRDTYLAMRPTFLRPSALDAPLVEHHYLAPVHVGAAVRFEVNPLWNPRTV